MLSQSPLPLSELWTQILQLQPVSKNEASLLQEVQTLSITGEINLHFWSEIPKIVQEFNSSDSNSLNSILLKFNFPIQFSPTSLDSVFFELTSSPGSTTILILYYFISWYLNPKLYLQSSLTFLEYFHQLLKHIQIIHVQLNNIEISIKEILYSASFYVFSVIDRLFYELENNFLDSFINLLEDFFLVSSSQNLHPIYLYRIYVNITSHFTQQYQTLSFKDPKTLPFQRFINSLIKVIKSEKKHYLTKESSSLNFPTNDLYQINVLLLSFLNKLDLLPYELLYTCWNYIGNNKSEYEKVFLTIPLFILSYINSSYPKLEYETSHFVSLFKYPKFQYSPEELYISDSSDTSNEKEFDLLLLPKINVQLLYSDFFQPDIFIIAQYVNQMIAEMNINSYIKYWNSLLFSTDQIKKEHILQVIGTYLYIFSVLFFSNHDIKMDISLSHFIFELGSPTFLKHSPLYPYFYFLRYNFILILSQQPQQTFEIFINSFQYYPEMFSEICLILQIKSIQRSLISENSGNHILEFLFKKLIEIYHRYNEIIQECSKIDIQQPNFVETLDGNKTFSDDNNHNNNHENNNEKNNYNNKNMNKDHKKDTKSSDPLKSRVSFVENEVLCSTLIQAQNIIFSTIYSFLTSQKKIQIIIFDNKDLIQAILPFLLSKKTRSLCFQIFKLFILDQEISTELKNNLMTGLFDFTMNIISNSIKNNISYSTIFLFLFELNSFLLSLTIENSENNGNVSISKERLSRSSFYNSDNNFETEKQLLLLINPYISLLFSKFKDFFEFKLKQIENDKVKSILLFSTSSTSSSSSESIIFTRIIQENPSSVQFFMSLMHLEIKCCTVHDLSINEIQIIQLFSDISYNGNPPFIFYSFLIQLLAKKNLVNLRPTFIIQQPKVLPLFLEIFIHSPYIEQVIIFLSSLFDYSILNAESCFIGHIDEWLANYFVEHRNDPFNESNVKIFKNLLSFFEKIVQYSCSISIANSFIQAITPINGQKLSNFHDILFNSLIHIFEMKRSSTLSKLPLCSNEKILFSGFHNSYFLPKYSICFWLYVNKDENDIPNRIPILSLYEYLDNTILPQDLKRISILIEYSRLIFEIESDIVKIIPISQIKHDNWQFISLNIRNYINNMNKRCCNLTYFLNGDTSAKNIHTLDFSLQFKNDISISIGGNDSMTRDSSQNPLLDISNCFIGSLYIYKTLTMKKHFHKGSIHRKLYSLGPKIPKTRFQQYGLDLLLLIRPNGQQSGKTVLENDVKVDENYPKIQQTIILPQAVHDHSFVSIFLNYLGIMTLIPIFTFPFVYKNQLQNMETKTQRMPRLNINPKFKTKLQDNPMKFQVSSSSKKFSQTPLLDFRFSNSQLFSPGIFQSSNQEGFDNESSKDFSYQNKTFSTINESEDAFPKMNESEDIFPKMNESEGVFPKMNESEDAFPKMNESEDIFPKMNESEDIFPKINESEDIFPKMNESEGVFPKMNESEDAFPKMNESEGILPKMNESKDVFPILNDFKGSISSFDDSNIDIQRIPLNGKKHIGLPQIPPSIRAEKLPHLPPVQFEQDQDASLRLNYNTQQSNSTIDEHDKCYFDQSLYILKCALQKDEKVQKTFAEMNGFLILMFFLNNDKTLITYQHFLRLISILDILVDEKAIKQLLVLLLSFSTWVNSTPQDFILIVQYWAFSLIPQNLHFYQTLFPLSFILISIFDFFEGNTSTNNFKQTRRLSSNIKNLNFFQDSLNTQSQTFRHMSFYFNQNPNSYSFIQDPRSNFTPKQIQVIRKLMFTILFNLFCSSIISNNTETNPMPYLNTSDIEIYVYLLKNSSKTCISDNFKFLTDLISDDRFKSLLTPDIISNFAMFTSLLEINDEEIAFTYFDFFAVFYNNFKIFFQNPFQLDITIMRMIKSISPSLITLSFLNKFIDFFIFHKLSILFPFLSYLSIYLASYDGTDSSIQFSLSDFYRDLDKKIIENNFSFQDLISFNTTDIHWSLITCLALLTQESDPKNYIFDFLINRGEDSWESTYFSIVIAAFALKKDPSPYHKIFLEKIFSNDNNILSESFNSQLIFLEIALNYLLYHYHSTAYSESFQSIYENSSFAIQNPDREIDSQLSVEENDHQNISSTLRLLSVIYKYVLKDHHFYPEFGVRLDKNGKMVDVELIKNILSLMKLYEQDIKIYKPELIELETILCSYLIDSSSEYAIKFYSSIYDNPASNYFYYRHSLHQLKISGFNQTLDLQKMRKGFEIFKEKSFNTLSGLNHLYIILNKMKEKVITLFQSSSLSQAQYSKINSNVKIVYQNCVSSGKRSWYKLWKVLTSERSSWNSALPDNDSQNHYKRSFYLCSDYYPPKLTRNFKYTNHKDESIIRDVGCESNANELIQVLNDAFQRKQRAHKITTILDVSNCSEQPSTIKKTNSIKFDDNTNTNNTNTITITNDSKSNNINSNNIKTNDSNLNDTNSNNNDKSFMNNAIDPNSNNTDNNNQNDLNLDVIDSNISNSNLLDNILFKKVSVSGNIEDTQKTIGQYFSKKCEIFSFTEIIPGKLTLFEKYFRIMKSDSYKQSFHDYDEIKFIVLRTYCQKKTAIEIFLENGKNYFLNFGLKDQDQENQGQDQSSEAKNDFSDGEISSFFSKNRKTKKHYKSNEIGMMVIEQFAQKVSPNKLQLVDFKNFFKSSSALTSWQTGKLTNFQYLLKINLLSGRTFLDPSQYPIFPWVYVNFDSKFDPTNISNFRDLTKPIGALSPQRLNDLLQNYACFDDNTGYLYGSGPSAPLSVYIYLIRQEPMTTMHIYAQGGRFDLAARQFFTIEGTWNSCSHETNDYRELCPEFYYSPEFLINANNFDLGYINSGSNAAMSIDDVILPEWAEGKTQFSRAYDFIYKNRKALESDYVSQNLNHWLDLIFGYKQKSKADNNIYQWSLYPDVWETEMGKDPLFKQQIEAMLLEVGQIPQQLLTSPHPARLPQAFYNHEHGSTNSRRYSQISNDNNDKYRDSKGNLINLSQIKQNQLLNSQILFTDLQNEEDDLAISFLTSSGTIVKRKYESISNMNQMIYTETIDKCDSMNISELLNLKFQRAYIGQTNLIFIGKISFTIYLLSFEKKKQTIISPILIQNFNSSITSITSDSNYIALSFNDAFTSFYKHSYSNQIDFNQPQFIVQTFKEPIHYSVLSAHFKTFVGITKGNDLLFISLNTKRIERIVKLKNMIPKKILITPSWGFVLVYSYTLIIGKKSRFLQLYSINGEFIKEISIPKGVAAWDSSLCWKGFDWVSMVLKDNSIYFFEAFYMNIGDPINSIQETDKDSQYNNIILLRKQRLIAVSSSKGNVNVFSIPPCDFA